MWIWTVLFALTVLTASCEPYPKSRPPPPPHQHHAAPNRNQRIIKVQGPPNHYNHYHRIHHSKPVRSSGRPYPKHHGDEYIRPNHPPPIPPFFNGPSTNHIKHLPRPPPHVYHKSPSYGLGFPYKGFNSFRTTGSKDHFRVTGLSSIRPTSAASSGTIPTTSGSTYHSPTFKSPTYLPSPVGHHIISSDDNNGPIREIPAPNLGPKPHDDSFDGHLLDGSIDSEPAFFGSFDKDPGLEVNTIIKDSGIDVNSVIKDDATLLYPKGPTLEISNFDQGAALDVTNLVKDAAVTPEHSSGYEVTEHHNNLPSNDQIIKGHDGTKLYYAPDPDPSLPVHKVPPTSDPHSTPSNGQGVNNVYLPQISHGFPYLQGGSVGGGSLSSQDLFHLMHGIPTVPAVIPQPVVAFVGQPQSPGVLLPGSGANYYQQGPTGPSGGQYPQHDGNDISQYLAQPEIHNLLHNNPEYHHLQQQALGASHSAVVSQANYGQQSTYSPQNQYQDYSQSQYQATYKRPDLSGDLSKVEGFSNSEVNHNYQYEPEASESDISHSLTVIRQTKEGSPNSGTVKDLLLEDSSANELNYQEKYQEKASTTKTESGPIILQLKNIPEVPFYASLPNKKAAEALASLQAAGSVANNYLNRVKITRKDQEEEEEEEETNSQPLDLSQLRLSKPQKVAYSTQAKDNGRILKAETVQVGNEKTVVEIQPSVSIYAGKITSTEDASDRTDDDNVTAEDDLDFTSEGQEDAVNFDLKEDGSSETFGRRIRPKK